MMINIVMDFSTQVSTLNLSSPCQAYPRTAVIDLLFALLIADEK